MTRTTDKLTRAGMPRRNGATLKWSAAEYVPKKRWWWYVALGWIGLTLTLLFLALGEWSIAAVTAAATLALIIMYAVKPRVWNYKLTEKALMVGKMNWPLQRFRAFTIEKISAGKGRESNVSLVLIPRARFRPAVDIYLTGDEGIDIQIVAALERFLPYDEATIFQTWVRLIDRLARLLKLA